MGDEQRVIKYVHGDSRYKNFMDGKLHQAIDVMKSEDIFDAKMSMDMQKIVKGCDAERDVLLYTAD